MTTLAVRAPDCAKCGFFPVQTDRPYAKENLLCDECCNRVLKITWHVGKKVFHTRNHADAYRLANKKVKPAFPMMEMPQSPTTLKATSTKAPSVHKAKSVSVLREPIRQPCFIDLDEDVTINERHPADVDIELYDATEPYRGLTPDHN
jgi:hypothetical protein